MSPTISERDACLAVIGLPPQIEWQEGAPQPFDKQHFLTCTDPVCHRTSIRESDEWYRITEIVALHMLTGVRAVLTCTESYDGLSLTDKVTQLYILDQQGAQEEVTAIDPLKKLVRTAERTVPWVQVDRAVPASPGKL